MEFDVTNITFWVKEENPWQIIFDGYKKGIKPGKQVRPYKLHTLRSGMEKYEKAQLI